MNKIRTFNFKITLLLITLFSCTTQHNYKNELIFQDNICVKEFEQNLKDDNHSIWKNITYGSSKGASYVLTGLGKSTEVFIELTGRVVSSVLVCSPAIAIDLFVVAYGKGQFHDYDGLSPQCIKSVDNAVKHTFKTKLGEKIKQNTESWRCPNLDNVAQGILKITQCYEKNKESELAKKQWDTFNESPNFSKCLSNHQKEIMHNEYNLFSKRYLTN
jgi:hypothetical protein